MPLFSVIVPIHNRAHLIRDCIDSILAQRLQDFEVILVDNNSTDALSQELASYTDPRLTLTCCATPGPAAARMHGVRLSRGTYLSFIDSDDIWREDVLETVFGYLASPAAPCAVYLLETYFRADHPIDWSGPSKGGVVICKTMLDALWGGAPGACGLAGVCREYFENGAGFDENLWVGEDLDWALRHASIGPACLLRDQPRLGYRRHDDNITKDTGRYESWAKQLVGFAKSHRYATGSLPEIRRFIVIHLMGQVATLFMLRGYLSIFRIYPRIMLLAVSWCIFRPLFLTSFISAVVGKKLQNLKKRISEKSDEL